MKIKVYTNTDNGKTLKDHEWMQTANNVALAIATRYFRIISEGLEVEIIDDKSRVKSKYAFIVHFEENGKVKEANVFTNHITNKDARNSWISQAFSPYLKTIKNFNNGNKNFFYANNGDGKGKNSHLSPYNKFFLRNIKRLFSKGFTLGKYNFGKENEDWALGTLDDLNHRIEEIHDIEEFIDIRAELDESNTGNEGYMLSFDDNDERKLSIASRTDGVNGGETELVISSLLNLKFRNSNVGIKDIEYVSYIAVKQAESIRYLKRFKERFNINQLLVDDNTSLSARLKLINQEEKRVKDHKNENKQVRGKKQTMFQANLVKEFGGQRCFLCKWNEPKFLVASHIERYADIQNSEIYTAEEKVERQTSADNGFYLCALHDKMFEFGFIYVDPEKEKFVIDESRPKALINEIKESITKSCSVKEYMTPQRKEFCKIHMHRVMGTPMVIK